MNESAEAVELSTTEVVELESAEAVVRWSMLGIIRESYGNSLRILRMNPPKRSN